MPWVDKDKCTGCEVCVRICPVNAIYLIDGKAEIDMVSCIRCGKCHDVCPQEAVRHDSEKIPMEVQENIKGVEKLMENFETKEDKKAFLMRIIRHYNKEKMVAENTIKKINDIWGDIK